MGSYMSTDNEIVEIKIWEILENDILAPIE